jgi:outer membrane protein OmpA-like peptidoglycan-associated protein
VNDEFKPARVYEAIARVTKALSKEGIAKGRKNAQQGYQFRGIDDVYNALAPVLAENNLCVLPEVMEREVVERTTKSGTALFYVTVRVKFTFVSAEDSSCHHVVTYGEAMDSGDKATNKAMSAAYKYAAMQAFCIPTEGDNDADAQTHEVAAQDKSEPRSYNSKKDAFEAMPPDEQEFLRKIAADVSALISEGRAYDAYGFWKAQGLDADEMVAIQYLWNSKERSALTKAAEEWKARENAGERAKHQQIRRGATPEEREAA